jgi:hypothetical protein
MAEPKIDVEELERLNSFTPEYISAFQNYK